MLRLYCELLNLNAVLSLDLASLQTADVFQVVACQYIRLWFSYWILKTVSGVIKVTSSKWPLLYGHISNTDTLLCPFGVRIREFRLYALIFIKFSQLIQKKYSWLYNGNRGPSDAFLPKYFENTFYASQSTFRYLEMHPKLRYKISVPYPTPFRYYKGWVTPFRYYKLGGEMCQS